MAKTIGERMTKIETTLEYIKESVDLNRDEHKDIIYAFKTALETKADKATVNRLIILLTATVVGALSFLIKYTLFP